MRRRRDPKLQRYLLDGERVVVDVRQHWCVIAGPVLATAAGLFVAFWVDARIRVEAGVVAQVLWVAWFVLLGWLLFQVAQWRHDRFIATDKRLLMTYGLVTQKVAMMPFSKVTDMSYERTIPGRVFGYGQFVLESAGQDQALRTVDWVPHPDTTYRTICAEIFGLPGGVRVADADRDDGFEDGYGYDDGPGSGGPGGAGGGDDPSGAPGAYGSDSGPITSGDGPRSRGSRVVRTAGPLSGGGRSENRSAAASPVEEGWSYSRAIPLHRRAEPPAVLHDEVLYSSDDERRRRRLADTGPIPTTPPPSSRRPDPTDD